jgi:membrane protein implicated in regulation of membrane protease activity
MNAERTPRDDVVEEISKWGVGLGIVTFALFPLAIPILILTAVALLPLALPLVALALVAAVVAAPVMIVRRLVRSRVGRSDRSRSSSRHPRSAPIAH